MGDQIYPGFELVKVKPTVTKKIIEDFLNEHFNGVEFRQEKPEIEIVQIVGATTNNVFIYGMKLPWREIRQRLGMNKLGNSLVRWEDCVFGLSGKVLSFDKDQLHQHLMEGMGRTPVLNLFSEKFFKEQTGDFKEMPFSIQFLGDVREGMEKMLEIAGKVVQYRESSKSSPKKYLEAEFLFRLEAIQAICFLNKNPMFTSNNGTFKTPSNCSVTPNCGLGKDGEIINIKKYVDELGYVPFEAFGIDIIDHNYINLNTPRCWQCSNQYKPLGLDADMHFVAAVCEGCNPLKSAFAWDSEEFFRLAANPDRSKTISSHSNAQQRVDKFVLQIQGLQPLYDNLAHFERSAVAAEWLEFENHRRRIGMQHQVQGEITALDFVEKTLVDGVQHAFWRIKLDTKKTDLWRPEGVLGVSRCSLNPLVKNDNDDVDDTLNARVFRFFNNRMSGRLVTIEDLQNGNVVITLVVSVPEGIVLEPKKTMWIVPRPPSLEQTALKQSMSKWRTFMMERLANQKGKVPVTIISAKYLQTVEWINEASNADFWELKLDLGKLEYWRKATTRMANDYLAGDVDLKVNNRASMEIETFSTAARVIDVDFDDDVWTATVIVNVLPSHTIISNQKCNMAMWRAISFDKESLPDEYDEFWSIEELLAAHKTGIESIQDVLQPTYEDNYVVNRFFDCGRSRFADIYSIIQFWMERPKNFELSLLDFLLHKFHTIINHKTDVTGQQRLPCYPHYMQAIKKIQDHLNPSQHQAVKTVLKSRVSVIHGLPGTGKSQVCVDAAIHLLCLENGVVVLATPSNSAADYLYQTMLDMLDGLEIGFRVIRMLSMKREQVDLERQAQGTTVTDERYLHNAVRMHPLWTKDPIMLNILENDESLLTQEERKAKLAYILRIEHDILKSTHVVVATVGTTGDTRLESLAKEFKDSPRKISAIIVDEASVLTAPGLVPLLALQPTRIVLAGDDTQLSRVVSNESALNAGLDISWMTFIRMAPFAIENNLITLLHQQYRMCHQIACIVSNFAYGGIVRSDESVMERNYDEDERFAGLRKEFPELAKSHVAIYTYDETEAETAGVSFSFYNQKEIEITLHLARKLLSSGIPLDDIVVLSMYDSHCKKLLQTIKKTEDLKHLDVYTSDSFQGREKSIVILNMVRSNAEQNISFLRNKKRLIVGLSRAMDYLLFVGDAKTIQGSQIQDMLELIDDMKASGAQVIVC